MDNTKKRKIVRNFVIGYLIIQVLTIVVYLGFWSLHPEGITNVTNERMSPPPIFPDYKGTTIPYNIAPLNFRINVPAEVVYDVKNKEILSKASLITKDAFETFPAFSPDGKWLYFCTAPAQKMPENYDKVRYNLCRVAFDPDRGEISFPIDTLVHADSLSYTFPRISPDGRFLMYTETAYGQFPIWHPDAEIRMMDLENRTAMDMSALNSPDTDSYHSWSSNSDWVVFSSRRDNGLYTLPYICYIGKDGKPSKPFLLPQEDLDKYDYQLYSYNIPELTKGAVEVSPYEIQQVAEKNKPEQVRFK